MTAHYVSSLQISILHLPLKSDERHAGLQLLLIVSYL